MDIRGSTNNVNAFAHLATATCTAVCIGFATPCPAKSIKPSQPANSAACACDKTLILPVLGSASAPAVVRVLPDDRAAERDRKDEDRFREKAKSDDQLVSATFLLAGVTAVLALVTYLLFRSTRDMALEAASSSVRSEKLANDALALSRDELNAAHRAWVKANVELESRDEGGPVIVLQDDQIKVTLKFTLENVGNQPAMNVLPWVELIAVPQMRTRDFVIQRHDEICERARTSMGGKYDMGHSLFQRDKPFEWKVTVANATWKDHVDDWGGRVGHETVTILALGAVSYRTGVDQKVRQTRFAFGVGMRNGLAGGEPVPMLGNARLCPDAMPAAQEDAFLEPLILEGNLFSLD